METSRRPFKIRILQHHLPAKSSSATATATAAQCCWKIYCINNYNGCHLVPHELYQPKASHSSFKRSIQLLEQQRQHQNFTPNNPITHLFECFFSPYFVLISQHLSFRVLLLHAFFCCISLLFLVNLIFAKQFKECILIMSVVYVKNFMRLLVPLMPKPLEKMNQ